MYLTLYTNNLYDHLEVELRPTWWINNRNCFKLLNVWDLKMPVFS